MTILTCYCPTCGGDGEFEQPPCADGHGAECPEWACKRCGTAILIGTLPVVDASAGPARGAGRVGRDGDLQRRAA